MTQAIVQVVRAPLHILHIDRLFDSIVKHFHTTHGEAVIDLADPPKGEPVFYEFPRPVDERLTNPRSLRPLLGDNPSQEDLEVAVQHLAPRLGAQQARHLVEEAIQI
jgi:hypothetical protein